MAGRLSAAQGMLLVGLALLAGAQACDETCFGLNLDCSCPWTGASCSYSGGYVVGRCEAKGALIAIIVTVAVLSIAGCVACCYCCCCRNQRQSVVVNQQPGMYQPVLGATQQLTPAVGQPTGYHNPSGAAAYQPAYPNIQTCAVADGTPANSGDYPTVA